MVVEDEELFAYLLRRYTEKSGRRFVSAHLKEEALDLARREQPAVILVDINECRSATARMTSPGYCPESSPPPAAKPG